MKLQGVLEKFMNMNFMNLYEEKLCMDFSTGQNAVSVDF